MHRVSTRLNFFEWQISFKLGSPKTAGRYLAALESTGLLRSEKVGKEKLYLNHQLMATLEAT